jgi:catechol 2,3-dioxygenase-like lactoylglutathione lyase family enzyme
MFKSVDYMVVMVSNMKASIEFYRDKLGLPLKFESPDWTEFATGASTLALHSGGKSVAAESGTDKAAGRCTLGFNVSDIHKTYEDLKSKGVNFAMLPTRQEHEGIILASALDPDGLAISLSEHIKK